MDPPQGGPPKGTSGRRPRRATTAAPPRYRPDHTLPDYGFDRTESDQDASGSSGSGETKDAIDAQIAKLRSSIGEDVRLFRKNWPQRRLEQVQLPDIDVDHIRRAFKKCSGSDPGKLAVLQSLMSNDVLPLLKLWKAETLDSDPVGTDVALPESGIKWHWAQQLRGVALHAQKYGDCAVPVDVEDVTQKRIFGTSARYAVRIYKRCRLINARDWSHGVKQYAGYLVATSFLWLVRDDLLRFPETGFFAILLGSPLADPTPGNVREKWQAKYRLPNIEKDEDVAAKSPAEDVVELPEEVQVQIGKQNETSRFTDREKLAFLLAYRAAEQEAQRRARTRTAPAEPVNVRAIAELLPGRTPQECDAFYEERVDLVTHAKGKDSEGAAEAEQSLLGKRLRSLSPDSEQKRQRQLEEIETGQQENVCQDGQDQPAEAEYGGASAQDNLGDAAEKNGGDFEGARQRRASSPEIPLAEERRRAAVQATSTMKASGGVGDLAATAIPSTPHVRPTAASSPLDHLLLDMINMARTEKAVVMQEAALASARAVLDATSAQKALVSERSITSSLRKELSDAQGAIATLEELLQGQQEVLNEESQKVEEHDILLESAHSRIEELERSLAQKATPPVPPVASGTQGEYDRTLREAYDRAEHAEAAVEHQRAELAEEKFHDAALRANLSDTESRLVDTNVFVTAQLNKQDTEAAEIARLQGLLRDAGMGKSASDEDAERQATKIQELEAKLKAAATATADPDDTQARIEALERSSKDYQTALDLEKLAATEQAAEISRLKEAQSMLEADHRSAADLAKQRNAELKVIKAEMARLEEVNEEWRVDGEDQLKRIEWMKRGLSEQRSEIDRLQGGLLSYVAGTPREKPYIIDCIAEEAGLDPVVWVSESMTREDYEARFPTALRSTLTKHTTVATFTTTTAKMSAPGEQFEPRQTMTSEDMTPDPSKSIKLPPNRQALVDDILALYSCEPTIKRVERYTPDCVYDDQFVYANDRYKMAGQWFALPKLFKASKNERYEIIKNEPELIQFKNEQSWTFKLIPKTATINALVSLALEPETKDSDFIRVKYHKDQANDKDYSHEGVGFSFKKWQADQVMKHMDSKEVAYFEKDKGAAKEPVNRYGSGDEMGNAPKQNLGGEGS